MYPAGVSERRVEDITETLWGSRVSPSTISDLNQKIFERVEEWRKRLAEPGAPKVYADKNIRGSVFRAAASLRAICLPMGRLSFSISEM